MSEFAGQRRMLLVGLLRLRCPRCRDGRLFRGAFQMNDPCPVCGQVFEREPGYFLGAMYFSYAFAVAIVVPEFFLLWWAFPEAPPLLLPLGALILYLPLTPLVFRYSRTCWLYWERWGCPSELTSPEAWVEWKKQHPRAEE